LPGLSLEALIQKVSNFLDKKSLKIALPIQHTLALTGT